MALPHILIASAKPRDRVYKVADPDGLYFVFQTNGAKPCRMNCRHLGRQKTLYFGACPQSPARKKSETRARQMAADNTIMTIAKEWDAWLMHFAAYGRSRRGARRSEQFQRLILENSGTCSMCRSDNAAMKASSLL